MARIENQSACGEATAAALPHYIAVDRRNSPERRTWSVTTFISGSLKSRRRNDRRLDDQDRSYVDWYEPRLLYVVLGILLLSFVDAVLTLNLLKIGAVEVNSFMAYLIEKDIQLFAWTKMALTGFCLVVLAAHANLRWLKMFRVERMLHLILPAYVCLIVYEITLLNL